MNQNKTDDKKLDKTEDVSKENLGMEGSADEKNHKAADRVEEKNDKTTEKTGDSEKVSENNQDDNAKSEINGQEESQSDQNEKEINELKEQIQRLAAEFDNYKKRTRKEKERIYASSIADVVSAFLPVVDNIERALQASEGSDESIRNGVIMIHRQIMEVLSNLGVKPIETKGQKFNPDFHEAVMHIEDENYGENEIVEEFLKGYIYNDETVIRHSVVKVAN
ncbi:MAG: nucleotide exchange factor GrpE [Clostridiaceae bacterium]|mgnify:CR=1 FL=1|nr:nucleotide exchange factor GrpE [Clostridiaceae bacterium]